MGEHTGMTCEVIDFDLRALRGARSFWYLATPYSKYPGGIEAAFKEACKATGWLIYNRVPVFCPIAHTHPVAIHADMNPLDHKIWMPADRPMMFAAHGMIVAKMPSWEESTGIAEETRVFMARERPICYMEWPL